MIRTGPSDSDVRRKRGDSERGPADWTASLIRFLEFFKRGETISDQRMREREDD
jgi:hypothetical protein